MDSNTKFTSWIFIVLVTMNACSKEQDIDCNNNNYSLKSITSDGRISEKFIYNVKGEIAESQSFYFCNKFKYDESGRLTEQEIAVDPDLVSNLYHEKTGLMTSQNTSFTGKYIFEYNMDGKLEIINNFFKKMVS